MFAFTNPLDLITGPLGGAIGGVLHTLAAATHSLGWSLVILAALVKLVLWPLAQVQFKSMGEMQKVAPLVKKLQAQYKNDPQKRNAETMALYKEHKVNPMAGCLPLLLQLPVLFSLYVAIQNEHETFAKATWLWINGAASEATHGFLAPNLGAPDMLLLGLYVISMYFSVRYGTAPAADPQQAQQQKIMAFISPVMIAFIGRTWQSALIVYWLWFNLFSLAQSIYFLRKYKMIGVGAGEVAAAAPTAALNGTPKNVTPRDGARAKSTNGSTSARKRSRR